MLVSQDKIDYWISQWEGASKPELRSRLSALKKKPKTGDVIAEIKAITALLA